MIRFPVSRRRAYVCVVLKTRHCPFFKERVHLFICPTHSTLYIPHIEHLMRLQLLAATSYVNYLSSRGLAMINISKRCDVSVLSPIYLDDEKRGALEGPFKSFIFGSNSKTRGTGANHPVVLLWIMFPGSARVSWTDLVLNAKDFDRFDLKNNKLFKTHTQD